MKKKSINLKELSEKLQPIRDELNLKMVMTDLREFDIPGLGIMLNLIEKIHDIFTDFKIPVFLESTDLLLKIVGDILMEELSYPTTMSYTLNLYEIIEDALCEFLKGEDNLSEFKNRVVSFKKLYDPESENEDFKSNVKEDTNKSLIIQELPGDDLLDESILIDFISECIEGLELSENQLLELEKDINNSDKDNMINSIFRIVHTMKGTSGFLKLPAIGSISHHMEDLLVQIRDGKRKLTPTTIDIFLQTIDILKQLIVQIRELVQGEKPEPVDIGTVYELLSGILISDEGQRENIKDSDFNSLKEPVKKIGEILADLGHVTDDDLEEALSIQQSIQHNGEHTGDHNGEKKDEGKIDKKVASKADKNVDMVKVPAGKLDELAEIVGELVVALSVLSENPVISSISDREANERLDQLNKVTEILRDRIIGIRMFPVGNVFSKLNRQVRDLSKKFDKKINLTIEGADTLVDKTVIDGIFNPLMHLIRNAIDHGIECPHEREKINKSSSGNVLLKARHVGDAVIIETKDDGRGLQKDKILEKAIEKGLAQDNQKFTDQQIFSFIFQAGFSTAKKATEVSGRGVGMDVVKRDVEKLRGKISIVSQVDVGTTYRIKLPLTTSIIEGLVIRIGPSRFVVPILDINVTVIPKPEEVKGVQGSDGEFFILAGELVPIIRLYEFYGILPDTTDPSKSFIIVVNDGDKKYGIMSDEIISRQQIVIKNLGDRFKSLQGISGGTILGDGSVGLILEPEELINNFRLSKIE